MMQSKLMMRHKKQNASKSSLFLKSLIKETLVNYWGVIAASMSCWFFSECSSNVVRNSILDTHF